MNYNVFSVKSRPTSDIIVTNGTDHGLRVYNLINGK